MKKHVKDSDKVWLASDEDREGEAIAWHLYENLDLINKDYERIVFHEITKNAILKALESPREINFNLVNAQQARRVLDRLVGYDYLLFYGEKLRLVFQLVEYNQYQLD